MVNLRINWTLYTGEVRNLEEIRRNTQAKTSSKNPTRGGANVYLFFKFTIITIIKRQGHHCPCQAIRGAQAFGVRGRGL